MRHADELLEHLFGDRKVCDHAVFHRTDGADIARNATKHLFGGFADSVNGRLAVRSAFLADGDNARLIENDAFTADVNQGVGRTEIDGEIVGEVVSKEAEHRCFALNRLAQTGKNPVPGRSWLNTARINKQ